MSAEIEIRAAGPSDEAQIADLLAAAFADEPYFSTMLGHGPGSPDRGRRLFGLQLRHQYLPHGVVDVAIIAGRIAGAGLWAPPGSKAGTLRAQVRLVPAYLRLTGRRFAQAVRAEVDGAHLHPGFPHWYLYMLGSHPDFRGEGVGRRLLEHRLERLPADAAAYLEASTADSARLYARYGFVHLGKVPMGGGRTLQGMWRPASHSEG